MSLMQFGYKNKDEIMPITNFIDEMLENKIFSLVI